MTGQNKPSITSNVAENERLAFALHAAGVGTWDLDIFNELVSWDNRCKELYGFSGEDWVPYDQVLANMHPDDQGRVDKAVKWALHPESGGLYDIEFRTLGAHDGQLRWLHCKGQAYFNEQKKPYRFSGVAIDITHLKQATEKAAQLEAIAQLAFESSSAGFFRLNVQEDTIEHSPGFAAIVTGNRNKRLDRAALIQHIHPEDELLRQAALENAVRTGHLCFEPRVIWEDGSLHRIRLDSQSPGHQTGKAFLFTGVVTIITDFEASLDSPDSEASFRKLITASPMAMGLFSGPELAVDTANEAMLNLLGKGGEIIGKPLEQALSERIAQSFVQSLREVYATGEPLTTFGQPMRPGPADAPTQAYYDCYYTPLRNGTGSLYAILVTAVNGTAQVHSRQQLAISEARFRSLIDQAPIATCLFVGRELVIEVANEPMLAFWGKGDSALNKPLAEALPELVGQPFLQILDDVYTTGRPYQANAAKADLIVNGQLGTYYFNFTYKPLFDQNGQVYAIMDMAIDVTQQVLANQELVEAKESLRDAVELAEMGTWSVYPNTNVFSYSDRMANWFGSGIQQEPLAVAYRHIHERDQNHVETAIIRAMNPHSDGTMREEYTIINQTTGQERILHTRGRTFFNEAGQPYVMHGTAQDVTEQRQIQSALEQQVSQRTQQLQASVQDLQRSNENLQQFAYIASHDLQEPLRKIQSFGNILQMQYAAQLGQGVDFLSRMQVAANRMSVLIRDLLAFSRIST